MSTSQTRPDRIHTLTHPGAVTSELRLFDTPTVGPAPCATVLILPGMGMGARYYDPFARSLADTGIATATMELPGQGTSTLPMSRRGPASGYHDAAYADIPLALAELSSEHPLFLLGHSQGGQLAAYFMARNALAAPSYVPHPPVAGLIGVASPSPYYRGYPTRVARRLLIAAVMLPAIGAIRGAVPARSFGFSGTQPARRITDWARLVRRGTMNPIAADISYPRAMADSRAPVLAITVAGDAEAPVDAARNWLDFFPAAPRTMRHVAAPLGHTRWARSPEPVTAYVRDWIDRLL